MKRFAFLIMTLLLLSAAACSGATTNTAEPAAPEAAMIETAEETMAEDAAMDDEMMQDESMSDETHDDTMMDESTDEQAMSDEAMVESDEVMADLAAWQTIPLTNARTSETFTLGDFAGKTVFVEPMATWCSNCRQQLTNVQQARAQLGSDDVVFVALSVETNISDADLAQYADSLGFDWTFAVMTPDLLQALAGDFGRTITNPPSTPHFVISPDGSVSDLFTGIKSPDDIVALASS